MGRFRNLYSRPRRKFVSESHVFRTLLSLVVSRVSPSRKPTSLSSLPGCMDATALTAALQAQQEQIAALKTLILAGKAVTKPEEQSPPTHPPPSRAELYPNDAAPIFRFSRNISCVPVPWFESLGTRTLLPYLVPEGLVIKRGAPLPRDGRIERALQAFAVSNNEEAATYYAQAKEWPTLHDSLVWNVFGAQALHEVRDFLTELLTSDIADDTKKVQAFDNLKKSNILARLSDLETITVNVITEQVKRAGVIIAGVEYGPDLATKAQATQSVDDLGVTADVANLLRDKKPQTLGTSLSAAFRVHNTKRVGGYTSGKPTFIPDKATTTSSGRRDNPTKGKSDGGPPAPAGGPTGGK